MADTGLRSFGAQSGWISGANVIDDNDTTKAQVFDFSGNPVTAFVSELEGDDIPAGAIINGIEIETKSKYGTNPTGGITFTVSVSNNATTETFGSSSSLWGISWGGWIDITNLAVKIIFTPGTTAVYVADMYEVRAKLYYTPLTPPPPPGLLVKGGNFKILSGKVIIK